GRTPSRTSLWCRFRTARRRRSGRLRLPRPHPSTRPRRGRCDSACRLQRPRPSCPELAILRHKGERPLRRLAISLCLLAGAACGALPGGLMTPAQKLALQRTVKVAVVGVFSGPSATLGRDVRNSLQLEADQLNAKGGVLNNRVEVVAADSELNPAKTAELVRQQLADNDVKLLGGPSFTAGYLAV